MKHIYAEMIKAKADNMELVTFYKEGGSWFPCAKANKPYLPDFDAMEDYFLCLPQHREACLHWLNGGDVQYKLQNESKWIKVAPYLEMPKWRKGGFFNSHGDYVYRIKPKKERRWIAYMGGNVIAIEPVRIDAERRVIAKGFDIADVQIIEIEVEIK